MVTGPDFSTVDSRDKAEQLARAGQLEPLLLLPEKFGGNDVAANVVYVPVGLAAVKESIDNDVIVPLAADGRVTHYAATPEYTGTSFVPIAITITASNPGSFTTRVALWGPALEA